MDSGLWGGCAQSSHHFHHTTIVILADETVQATRPTQEEHE